MAMGANSGAKQKKDDAAAGNSMVATYNQENSDRQKVFDPKTEFMKKWDSTICIALAFTAFVTPFEIGYLSTKLDLLFFINRIVDVVFCCDIYINLRLAYFDNYRSNWVYNPTDCALHYMKGWFTIDVVSLVPWDVIAFVAEQSATTEEGGGGDMESLKILRLLKILKITKLVRMVKAIRIFKRIATQLKMSHTQLMLFKYCMIMVVATHWLACAWGLLPAMLNDDEVLMVAGVNATAKELTAVADANAAAAAAHIPTWKERLEADAKEPLSISDTYSYSLEYSLSVMCMGFGTVEPANSTERWFSIFSLLFAGMLYAYVVGGICAAIANEDPAVTAYNENMDMLMIFLEKHEIPPELRIEAYDYFAYSRALLEDQCHLRVLDFMAPSLRSKICAELYGEWLKKVPFFNPARRPREQLELHMNISLLLEPVAFPPDEIAYMVGDDSTCMYIVQRGLLKAVYMHSYSSFRILTVGQVFGAEAIEACSPRRSTVRSLSFVSLARLNAEDLFNMLARKPKALGHSRIMIAQAAARSSLTAHMRKLGRAMIELRVSMGAKRRTAEEFFAIKNVTLHKIERVRQERAKAIRRAQAVQHASKKLLVQRFKTESQDTAASALGAMLGSAESNDSEPAEPVEAEEGQFLYESAEDRERRMKEKPLSRKEEMEVKRKIHMREVQEALQSMTATFGNSYFHITNPHEFVDVKDSEDRSDGESTLGSGEYGPTMVKQRKSRSPTNGAFVGDLYGEWRHVSHAEVDAPAQRKGSVYLPVNIVGPKKGHIDHEDHPQHGMRTEMVSTGMSVDAAHRQRDTRKRY
jgi:potassium voltage-gated channel Eag-related subfamily H protein 7